jgi:hypothetical protein
MKPGSLVMYIGGQKPYDIKRGLELETNRIYVVDGIGWGTFGTKKVKKQAISLKGRPGQIHSIKLFKEIPIPSDNSYLLN